MLTINKILFPTDFSRCSDHALIRALYLAERHNAELHIVHVLLPLEYDPNNTAHRLPDLKEVQKEIDKLASRQLHAVQAVKSYEQLTIVTRTLRGISAAPTILDYAEETGFDLIVMGTHGRRGLNHLMLGSVAEEVVRIASCPVLTVREVQKPALLEDPREILVPLDYSEHSRDALSYAKEIASQYGARVRLLHVVEEIIHPSFYVTGQTALTTWYPDVEAFALNEMSRLASEAKGPSVPIEFHVKEGHAVIDIVNFAKRNSIDLIVMASHGLTGIAHMLLGSVAEKVIRMSPCPVFVVKSFGKSLLKEREISEAAPVSG